MSSHISTVLWNYQQASGNQVVQNPETDPANWEYYSKETFPSKWRGHEIFPGLARTKGIHHH